MKKSMLLLVMSVGIVMVGNAGNLSVSGTDLTYEMGVGVSAGTEFLVRYDFGSVVLTSPIEAGDLSITSTSTGHSISVRSGGAAGDSFVEFRIILNNTIQENLSAGDKIVLDASQFGLDSTSYTVTATLMDDFGEFDTSGTHSVTFSPPVEPTPTPEPTPEPTVAPTPTQPTGPTIRRVPTLSEWGFLLSAMLVLGIGVVSIRKKYN